MKDTFAVRRGYLFFCTTLSNDGVYSAKKYRRYDATLGNNTHSRIRCRGGIITFLTPEWRIAMVLAV